MKFTIALCSVFSIGLVANAATPFVPRATVIADFESSDPAATIHSQDQNVMSEATQADTNKIDGSRALKFTVTLEGLNEGWAGCSLPVKNGAEIPAGADAVTFDAQGLRPNAGMFVTLTEADGSRWNTNVRLTPDWRHYRIPIGSFTPFTLAKGREGSRPRPQSIVSIDPWVGNALSGGNGFELDNVSICDDQPPFILRCASQTTIPLQQVTTLLLEATETTGGEVSSFHGDLWCDVPDRNQAHVSEKVAMKYGRSSIQVFPRRPGPLDVYVYEPETRTETHLSLEVAGGLQTELSFDGFDGQQLVFANQTLVPRLKLYGSGAVPLAAHISVRDHNGRLVVSQFESIAALSAGKGRIAIPSPGFMSVEVKVLAQPLSSFPHVPNNLPVPIIIRGVEQTDTSASVALPDGVTTQAVIGSMVTLEDIPATATVLGQDRFDLWAITVSPSELLLYNSPFGICSGALFDLGLNEITTLGYRRLNWHRKLGSFWAQNDILWDQTEPLKGTFNWEKASFVINAYHDRNLTLLGILGYASKWSNGLAPSNEAERKEWRDWVSALIKQFSHRFKALEVWNEPNQNRWAPKSNPDAYRELVKATFEQVRAEKSVARIVAGGTAGYDPAFLEHLMEDGYGQYWDVISLHPYPESPQKSPEENAFGDICLGIRALMRKHGLSAKECWMSELGWPSGPGGVTELDQANYLVRAYTMARYYDIHKVFWFDLCDKERMPWVGEIGAHMGLIDSSFRPKPAATAYNLMSFMLNQLTAREVLTQGKASIYAFTANTQSVKWGGSVYVAWTPSSDDEQDIELPMTAGGPILAFDYLGAEQIPVVVSQTPIQPPVTAVTTGTKTAAHNMHETEKEEPLMRKVCRFHVTNEPLYIWESIRPPKPHHDDD